MFNIIVIRFGRCFGRGLNCWFKIPRGPPTSHEIKVNFHRDFMASTHSDFFQGHMDRSLFYWPNLTGETRLSK